MELVRGVLLEHLQRDGELAALWFTDQQVDVLGHDDVSGDKESVPSAHPLKGLLEDRAGLRFGQELIPVMTAEGDEMETAGLLESVEAPGHMAIVGQSRRRGCDLRKLF
jgi:hypothetical protein